MAYDNVQAICQTADGALWFATAGAGVSRFDQATRRWQTFNEHDGLASSRVKAICQSADGALWFATADRGLSRYDQTTASWRSFTRRDDLAGDQIQAMRLGADAMTLWIATRSGISRIITGGGDERRAGAVTTLRRSGHTPLLSISGAVCAQTRPSGISLCHSASGASVAVACSTGLTAMACAPPLGICSGGSFSGLQWHPAEGAMQVLGEQDGLPSDHILALAGLPGEPQRLWLATAAGAALIRVGEDTPRPNIERVLSSADGLPGGPVNAILALADGAVFLAYNARHGRWMFDPQQARRRALSQVVYVSSEATGPASTAADPQYFYRAQERLNNLEIRSQAR
jgi:ligand-binding sensor domain-containing protein